MTQAQTASSAAFRSGEAFSLRRQFEDWSEIEALLASSTPLCGRMARAVPLVRRGRYVLLAGLVACFSLAVLPLDRARLECAAASCAPNASADRVVARRPERVARAIGPREEARLREGRSSAADARGLLDDAPATVPRRAPVPQQASFSATGDPEVGDASSGGGPEHAKHHHHHAWWAQRHYQAWR